MTDSSSDPLEADVDRGDLRDVLDEHPIRLAVLFGSTVREDRHPQSDVDIVVEFDHCDPTTDERLALIADLSKALDRNDVDLADVDDLDPHVGSCAFAEGELLVGSEDRFQELHRRFRSLADRDDQPDPGERFDEVVERIEKVVEG